MSLLEAPVHHTHGPRSARMLTGPMVVIVLLAGSTLAIGGTLDAPPAPGVDWTLLRPGDGSSPTSIVTLTGAQPGFAVAFASRVDLHGSDGALMWSAAGLPAHGNTLAAADLNDDGTDDVVVASAGDPTEAATLSALDGTDGTLLWSVATGGTQVNDIAVTGQGPLTMIAIAAMPSLGDGRVEAYRGATGEPMWSQDAGDVVTTLVSGLITIAATQSGQIQYYETTSGTPLQTMELADAGFIRDLVPVPGTSAGVTLVVVGDQAVVGLTGIAVDSLVNLPVDIAWTYTTDARFWSGIAATAALPVGGTTVYINGWDGAHVHALDSASGDPLWTAGDGGTRSSLPFVSPRSVVLTAVGDDTPAVVAAGAGNRLRAYDRATGDELWNAPTPGPTDALATIEADDGSLVALAQLYWFVGAVNDEGELSWSHDYSSYQAGTSHDMDGDGTADAVVSSAGHVYVLDGATGDTALQIAMWPYVANAVTTNVAVADLTRDGVPDIVATARTGNIRGVVAAFDGTSGAPLWTSFADYIIGGVTGRPLIHDLNADGVPDVVFGSNKGHPSHVIAVSGLDGTELWRYHTGDNVLDLALASGTDGPAVIALRDHTSCACFVHPGVIALDPANGTVRWAQDVRDNRATDIAVLQGGSAGTDRIVVRDGDDPPADDGEPLDGDGPRFAYLDPATGQETGRILLSLLGVPDLDAGPFFVTGDVDGDTIDDIVLTLREPRGRDALTQVVVLSGQDDSVLWSSDALAGTANVLTVGPARTQGGADVLAAWSEGTIARLDGASGAARWHHAAVGAPVWFLAAGHDASGQGIVFTPQGTVLQSLVDP